MERSGNQAVTVTASKETFERFSQMLSWTRKRWQKRVPLRVGSRQVVGHFDQDVAIAIMQFPVPSVS